jgi:hypothetical protein
LDVTDSSCRLSLYGDPYLRISHSRRGNNVAWRSTTASKQLRRFRIPLDIHSDDVHGCAIIHHAHASSSREFERGNLMVNIIWTVIVALFVLWVLGFALHVGGGLIHLLLVIAAVLFVFNLLTGRGARV